MKNAYGIRLDRNGYAPSLLEEADPESCWLCRRERILERHELYGGAARQRSKELGLWVSLCAECHRTGREAVHNCRATREELQGAGQLAAMRAYGWSADDFRAQIGKSYILAEEESA